MPSKTKGVLIILLASLSLFGRQAVGWAAPDGASSPAAATGPIALDKAVQEIPKDTRALVLIDARLYKFLATDVQEYARAAAARRKFVIAVFFF